MSGVQLHQLGFDAADAADSQNVGAFLRAGSDGDLISSTLVSGKEGLDVNLINASIAVTATDLDIRDLSSASDSVAAVQSGAWTVGVSGTVAVTATDLDIRDLAFATDSVTAHQGGSWSVTATATDLDIRDLSHSQDSVKVGDGTEILAINSDGSINVVQGAYDTIAHDALTVGTSEVQLVAASPVANRRYVLIQNTSSNPIYVGATGVTTADGIMIPKNANLPLEASAGVYAIAGSAGNEVRILELGYGV